MSRTYVDHNTLLLPLVVNFCTEVRFDLCNGWFDGGHFIARRVHDRK